MEQRSASDILSEKMASIGNLPAGSIYLSAAKEGDVSYISAELLSTMYGIDLENVEEHFKICEDIAIYLSNSAPYEIAVFKCYSSTDASSIAALCMKRIENMRVLLRNTEWYSASDGAHVEISQHIVIATFC